MELTLDEALQKAVKAHKTGQVQEADRLYKAILKAQPKHPDANHNMGVLATGAGMVQESLPFFKTALEANPKIEQFWLSYVGALLKGNQFESAKQVLEQGKKEGLVAGEEVNTLVERLTLITQATKSTLPEQKKSLTLSEKHKKLVGQKKQKKVKEQNLKVISPTEVEIKSLLELYLKERYDDAENLGISITKRFPGHEFAWKILGAIFGLQFRLAEALHANQKVVQLVPRDAEAHNNLGVSMQRLGRLEEAEACFRQATALEPDYAEHYYNLGVILKTQGRFEDAEESYRQAIAVKSDYTQAYYNLGVMLQELRRFEDAEESYRQTIVLKADYAEAHNNLGVTLKQQGRLEKAEASLRQTIALKSDYAEAHNNLGSTLHDLGRLDEAEASYSQAIALKFDYTKAHINLGHALKELGRLDEAEACFRQAITLQPDSASSHFYLGLLFYSTSQYEKALEQFNSTNFGESKSHLLRCLYLLDKQSLFFDELDYLINQNQIDALVGSLGCRSALRYKIERPNLFCKDPLKYVFKTDLKNQCDFEKIFVKTAMVLLTENMVPYRTQSLLTNGQQTYGNLFNLGHDSTEEIQKIIRAEVDNYKDHYKDSEEGIISNWPADYSIVGWLISMKSGGELRPHMHESGWLSGSVYINVPQKKNTDSGNLVVCIEDEEFLKGGVKNPKTIVNVVTGSLVLFPSSLLHYTIPFESEEKRIVLAFDVVPKKISNGN
jgi:tetratricopeptide (TPR) repeat protein